MPKTWSLRCGMHKNVREQGLGLHQAGRWGLGRIDGTASGVLTVIVLAVVLGLAPLRADQPTPPPPDVAKIMVVDADLEVAEVSPDGFEIKTEKDQPVRVKIKNTASRRLVITHVGLNASRTLLAIAPLELMPGEIKPLEILVDGTKILLPSQLNLFLRVKDGAVERMAVLSVQISSKNILIVQPRSLAWIVGEGSEAKESRIVSVPVGIRITGVRSSDEAFAVKLEGDRIVVIPKNTSEPDSCS